MSWDLSSEEVIVNKLESQQKTILAFSKKIKELEKKLEEAERDRDALAEKYNWCNKEMLKMEKKLK